MAGFYNPMSPNIQFGQGISDVNQQVQQLMMLQRMFTQPNQRQPQQGQQQPQGQQQAQDPNAGLQQLLRAFIQAMGQSGAGSWGNGPGGLNMGQNQQGPFGFNLSR